MIKLKAGLAWTWITIKWGELKAWFKEHVTDPVVKYFTDAWEIIKTKAFVAWALLKQKWEETWNGIKTFAKNTLNGIIDLLNALLRGMVTGINSLIKLANVVGDALPGKWTMITTIVAPQIPRLAKGAVIPPNSAFTAVLGDQTSGRNLEAPE